MIVIIEPTEYHRRRVCVIDGDGREVVLTYGDSVTEAYIQSSAPRMARLLNKKKERLKNGQRK